MPGSAFAPRDLDRYRLRAECERPETAAGSRHQAVEHRIERFVVGAPVAHRGLRLDPGGGSRHLNWSFAIPANQVVELAGGDWADDRVEHGRVGSIDGSERRQTGFGKSILEVGR